MSNSTAKFNVVKTIKLINKTNLLKQVYNVNDANDEYNYAKLKEQATKGTLNEATTDSLKEIFESVIKNRNEYLQDYLAVEEVEKTPRRYGKVQIEKDIEAQGGVATEIQLTKLALNDLKSMFLNLDGKATSVHYQGTDKISDTEGRAIREAIRTFRKKVGPTLKRRV